MRLEAVFVLAFFKTLIRYLFRNQHPNPEGHMKIAELFTTWLENWGLRPEASRPSDAS